MIKKVIFLAAALMFVSACSDDDRESGDHVWKEQTQVLDKAKEVDGLLEDVADQQRKIIDEQSQ